MNYSIDVTNVGYSISVLRDFTVKFPDHLHARRVLCELLLFEGYAEEAIKQSFFILGQDPSHRFQHAQFLLTCGRPEGWAVYEQCYRERGNASNSILTLAETNAFWFDKTSTTRWEGQITGHLFICSEQGIGDNIQFLRFISLAAERCVRLTVLLPESLRGIARQSFRWISNLTFCESQPPRDFDHWCLMMSLGFLLNAGLPSEPYLIASPTNHLAQIPGNKIGLVWSGSGKHPLDSLRSVQLSAFDHLLTTSNINFIALQNSEDIHERLLKIPLGDCWTGTASLMQELDLIISVDTAVAHMAGALGKPVWLLNRYNTDWRWKVSSKDSEWYSSMRIFRQPKMFDWVSVFTEVAGAIKQKFPNDK